MKEILFKAKTKYDSKWIFGMLIWEKDYKNYYIIQNNASNWDDYEEVIPETACQYTGLTDKNGNKIFEGDILTSAYYPYQDEGERNYNGIVEWVYASWQIVLTCVNDKKNGISEGMNSHIEEGSSFEIIGNIHD